MTDTELVTDEEIEAGAPEVGEILAFNRWTSNAHLLAHGLYPLGLIRDDWPSLDPTYGYGTWWKLRRPEVLLRHDQNPEKAPDGVMDFRDLQYPDGRFLFVAFDPDYKLRGTPSAAHKGGVDERFGVEGKKGWQKVHADMRAGLTECARVTAVGGNIAMKMQAQVAGGWNRWQDFEMYEHGLSLGLRLKARFYMESFRPQPTTNLDGSPRRQATARNNFSTLLVFTKPRARKVLA